MPTRANRLNILSAADYVAPSPGAFIQSLILLSERILSQGGRMAFLFSEDQWYLRDLRNFGPIYICNKTANRRFSWQAIINLIKACARIKADIVHIHFVGMAYLIAACLLKAIFRYKIIIHWRNPPRGLRPDACFIHRLSPLFYQILNFYFIDMNIVISNSIKDVLVKYKFGPASKISVIYNGIDTESFKMTRKQAQDIIEKLLNKKIYDRQMIGMIANFSFQKDHETVIRAAAVVKNEFPDALFIFVGSDKQFAGEGEMARLRALVNDLNLQENVDFIGEHPKVYEIIPRFDIGVLCSKFEGFGNAVVEYMMGGKAVIGTNIGGIAEIIQDGVTGYLVPPENSDELASRIVFLLRDHELSLKMGRAGKKIAESSFSLEKWVGNITCLYGRILDH